MKKTANWNSINPSKVDQSLWIDSFRVAYLGPPGGSKF